MAHDVSPLDYVPAVKRDWPAQARRVTTAVRRHAVATYAIISLAVILATVACVWTDSIHHTAEDRRQRFTAFGVAGWTSRVSNSWSENRFADGTIGCEEIDLTPGEADVFLAHIAARGDIILGSWPSERWPAPRGAGPMRYIAISGRGYAGVTVDGSRAFVEETGW